MKSTKERSTVTNQPSAARTLSGDPAETSTAPTLASIVQAICLDASYDSMKYVLRSDTSHDGE